MEGILSEICLRSLGLQPNVFAGVVTNMTGRHHQQKTKKGDPALFINPDWQKLLVRKKRLKIKHGPVFACKRTPSCKRSLTKSRKRKHQAIKGGKKRSGAAVSGVRASNSRTACLMDGSGGSLLLCSSGFHFHTEGATLWISPPFILVYQKCVAKSHVTLDLKWAWNCLFR